MKKIDLFGSELQGLSPFANSQQRLNCFYEVIPSGEKGGTNVYIRPTPGYELFVTLPLGPVQAFLTIQNVLYVVAGGTFYSVNPVGAITTIGVMAPSNTNGQVAIAQNGFQIIICNGQSGWIYQLLQQVTAGAGTQLAGAFYKITDSNFPVNCSSACFLNGFFIVNNPASNGEFVTSTVYDGTQWPALDYATAETSPDVLIALDSWAGNLILWGKEHIEYWQDNGGYPFPFTQLVGSAQEYGLAAQYSRCAFNNTFAFLGTVNNQLGQVQVFIIQDYAPVRISDHNIEHIINSFPIISDAVALTYTLDGHVMYQLTFPNANRSFLYDGTTSLWSELQSGVGQLTRHTANLLATLGNQMYISDATTGNLYLFASSLTTDNGNLIKRQVRSRHVEDGGNLFGIDEIWLDMQIGSGLQTGQGSNPQIMMEVSKDNGNTYGNERWTSIGLVGQYRGPRAIWRRMGQSRDFVFKFTLTDPVPFVIIRGCAMLRPTVEREGAVQAQMGQRGA